MEENPFPRKLNIDLDELARVFDSNEPSFSYYLDLEDGRIILVTEETRLHLNSIYDETMDEDQEEIIRQFCPFIRAADSIDHYRCHEINEEQAGYLVHDPEPGRELFRVDDADDCDGKISEHRNDEGLIDARQDGFPVLLISHDKNEPGQIDQCHQDVRSGLGQSEAHAENEQEHDQWFVMCCCRHMLPLQQVRFAFLPGNGPCSCSTRFQVP